MVYILISCPRSLLPFFFSVFPVYRIFLLCSPVSGDFQKPAPREDGAFEFQGEGEVNFIFLCLFSTEFLPVATAVR